MVFLDAGFEELVATLVIEIVEAVFDGSDQRETVISWDFLDGKLGEFRLWRWWCRRRNRQGRSVGD